MLASTAPACCAVTVAEEFGRMLRVEVLETMKVLAQGGMTMIVATHEVGSAREAGDSLAFFDAGRVLEKETPEKLLQSENERVRNFLDRVL